MIVASVSAYGPRGVGMRDQGRPESGGYVYRQSAPAWAREALRRANESDQAGSPENRCR